MVYDNSPRHHHEGRHEQNVAGVQQASFNCASLVLQNGTHLQHVSTCMAEIENHKKTQLCFSQT